MEDIKQETIEKVETVDLPLNNQANNHIKTEPEIKVSLDEKKYSLSEIKEIIAMFNINTNIVNEPKVDKKEPEILNQEKTKYEW